MIAPGHASAEPGTGTVRSGDEPMDVTLAAAPNDRARRDLAADETVAGPASSSETDRRTEDVRLQRGSLVGRYMVLRELGAGGMGVVYAAEDPELDRKVALKLLHTEVREPAGSGSTTAARTRLLREAQALAKLAHPNVVAVHDVGEHDGRVWLAMEYVDGVTLSAWLKEERRGWREVLAVMSAAGRGLAAAHEAGLLHRDFKPDNVMVARDGRVRVMDLGLAKSTQANLVAALEVSTDQATAKASELGVLAMRLTQAGALMGTPAYMSPEQFGGGEVDARADVFAYCVTLWESLYGEPPFAGRTLLELVASVLAGKVQTPASSRSVPRWLRRTCERGLKTDVRARWPSMQELLLALARGQTRMRTRRALAVVGAVVVLVAGGEGLRRHDVAQRVLACDAEGAAIDAVWNDAVRTKLRQGLLATQVSYAGTTIEKVMPYFDAQAEAWRAARTEVCLDARVRGTWSAELLDRSVWCLEETRLELSTLAAELSHADAKSIQKAVPAAATMGQVGPCSDALRLTRLPAPPEDRAGVMAVREELSRAGALLRSGSYSQGLATAQSALERAGSLDWPPLVAEARVLVGQGFEQTGAYDKAEAEFAEAYFTAAEAGAWGKAAEAASGLARALGRFKAEYDEGLRWARHIDVALSALGEPETGLRRALSLTHLANIHYLRGDYVEALALHARALAIREKTLGPQHPDVAVSLNNLAVAHNTRGEDNEAIVLFERALAIDEAALGAQHPDIAYSLHNLANLHLARGEDKKAEALYTRALAVREAALGPDHPNVAHSLNSLANLHLSHKEYAAAEPLLRREMAIFEKTLGPEHPDLATPLQNLADVHKGRGQNEAAIALLTRALAIREKAQGPEHPDLAFPLTDIADIELERGRAREALGPAERAVSILISAKVGGERLADSRFVLARALWDAPAAAGRSRPRAVAEARNAADAYRAASPGELKELALVEAWQGTHRLMK